MRASAPKAQKKSSLPLIGGAGALLLIVVLMTGSDDKPATTPPTTRKPKAPTGKDAVLYTPEDETAKFAPVVVQAKDVFTPTVKKPILATNQTLPPGTIAKDDVPVSVTNGEANWYYTGWVELNGVRQALLENTTSGETTYVGIGDTWKAARIRGINVSGIEMSGPNAVQVHVPLQQYGVVPGAAPTPIATNVPAAQPLAVPGGALSGPIGGLGVRPVANGGTVTLADGRTMQMAPAVSAEASNGNARGGRRRRNQSQDNSGVNNGQ